MTNKQRQTIARATGLLVIAVENVNPNGDPDRESDPRQRSHDRRGYISGVSFKRKLRDLVELKEGIVWQHMKESLCLDDDRFCILESRERGFSDVKDASEAWRKVLELIDQGGDGSAVANKYWDARVFGATFWKRAKTLRSQEVGLSHATGSLFERVSPISELQSLWPQSEFIGTPTQRKRPLKSQKIAGWRLWPVGM